jgi:hypothetical protein
MLDYLMIRYIYLLQYLVLLKTHSGLNGGLGSGAGSASMDGQYSPTGSVSSSAGS